MPPTRRATPAQAPRAIASAYLTQQFWEMKKSLQTDADVGADDEDCPVCLQSVLACRQCFCLLNCGHALHTSCFLQMHEAICPVCRA